MKIVGKTKSRNGLPACEIGEVTTEDGLPVLVVCNRELYDRDGSPYNNAHGHGWDDNDIRFATFSSVAADIAGGMAGMSWRPDILHLNDWTCGLAACHVAWRNIATPTIMTIHNLAYQGTFAAESLKRIGAPAKAPELDFHGQVSFLRGGLVHANCLTTVSDSYADQIIEPAHGCGMDGLLRKRRMEGRLEGIVNGIDDSWHPLHDKALAVPFSVGQWEQRAHNTHRLRLELGLNASNGPLFAFVSRMVHQKGLDLICEAAPQIVAAGGQLVMIGRGEPLLERAAATLAKRYPGRVSAYIGFEEGLARRMFAGSDFLLMPSRYEPCGLSQMYAQAYGSLPIAHATGGLRDTVEDGVSGLLFDRPHVSDLRRCLQRAFRIYAERPLLDAMRGAAMLERRGWEKPAQRYTQLYRRYMMHKVAA